MPVVTLAELAWMEATRLVALKAGLDLKLLRAPTAGTRGPRPPKTVWWARKLAMHLAVEGADAPPATVAKRLGRHRGTAYHAIDEVARARAADQSVDLEVRALELRMAAWRGRCLFAAGNFIEQSKYSSEHSGQHGNLIGGA